MDRSVTVSPHHAVCLECIAQPQEVRVKVQVAPPKIPCARVVGPQRLGKEIDSALLVPPEALTPEALDERCASWSKHAVAELLETVGKGATPAGVSLGK